MTRRGSLAGAVRGPRRATEWFRSPNISTATQLAAATFIFDLSFEASELAKRPFTITRTVGSIWVVSDQSAAFEFPFGALGMQLVSDKAVATGATALPDPITQEASDAWFVYQAFVAQGGTIQGRPAYRYDFDSRAQRKVEDGFDIAVMLANADAADGLQYLLKFRLLIKVA